MPDTTSSLLALYQQIVGPGVVAREQSALEAACAQRALLSGLTITPTGATTINGLNVVGALTVGSFTAGSFTVTNLTVTGTATIGTVNATGGTFTGLLTANGGINVAGQLSTTGVVTAPSLMLNSASFVGSLLGMIVTNLNAIVIQGAPGNSTNFMNMLNSSQVLCGSIVQTGATSVAYNTTSDVRLKRDRGFVLQTQILPRLAVHDFEWISDGTLGRGLFAQEVLGVLPIAVTVGSGDDQGSFTPWGIDYSKVVPDLIVGWQQHTRTLAALETDHSELSLLLHALQRRVSQLERMQERRMQS